ncbi:MAG: polyprenyl synthetase family protein [Planctomycetales bacterium]|nr:polyprenyl synthetase family protein [Planctomycetales bacterium]
MKTASTAPQAPTTPASDPTPRRRKRRSTSHLKVVPETKPLREKIRAACRELAIRLDRSEMLSKDEMESISRRLLDDLGLAEGYLGWTMVALTSAFWESQIAAVPPSRRLLLLPHCLKHAEGCPADYDEFGLDCKQCGACSIADFRTMAEDMGYKVLVAEGSPIVLKIIVSGYVDAIVGVACLNVLEKAIDKLILAGIPCMAVPLLSSDCRNTSVDEDWVSEMIQVRESEPAVKTRTYLHLMRTSSGMFDADELERLMPRLRGSQRLADGPADAPLAKLDPVASTEAIAYDFLAKGGKYARPFITLATYDALTGGQATLPAGEAHLQNLPDAHRRAALAIEVFHKASLVHDDIEDEDQFRYGEATLHRRFGLATALNVGDYMIGMGYRLVGRDTRALGPEKAADILSRLADAHMRLSEGQGAELVWRDALDKSLQPLDALKIYALKTAPAFEAALLTGIRLAGDVGEFEDPVRKFAQHLGIAFQILNDLKDWEGDSDNKLAAGGDVLGGRPTVLWALALEALDEADRAELLQLAATTEASAAKIERVRTLYRRAGVFEKAHKLVDKYQNRCEAIADEIQPEEFRRLLYYLIDTVLERPAETTPALVTAIVPSDISLVNEA